MRLEEYDRTHSKKQIKGQSFRDKEEKFDHFVHQVCGLAMKYNWNVWEGRTANPFAVTLSTDIGYKEGIYYKLKARRAISIKLCRDNVYRACFTEETNPNNNRVGDYTIEVGKENEEAVDFLQSEIEKFVKVNGIAEKQDYVFTINPIYHVREE